MIGAVLAPLIIFGIGALLITAALSPLETLSWWAGWTEEEIADEAPSANGNTSERISSSNCYVVYLSGIASISGRFLIPREKAFIKSLKAEMPGAVIIDDVFPYSPAGLPLLAAPRFFDRLWRRIQRFKLEGRSTMLSTLINMRNVFQVMISADHRYGPIYNRGAALVIEDALLRAGYNRDVAAPIVIVGYSGGAQIALGAATYLKAQLKAPIDIISIGGVMASEPGLDFVRQLHHLYGDKDTIQKMGAIMFPERWKVMGHSEWNTAQHEGRIHRHKLDQMLHAGARGYFGLPKVNGVSNNQRTLKKVVSILNKSAGPAQKSLQSS